MLLGRILPGEIRVEAARPSPNRHPEPGRRFQADAKAYLKASREAAARGWSLLGLYHSHPDGPGQPGVADLEACGEGEALLILPVGGEGLKDLSAWLFRRREALPLPVRAGA